MRRRFYVEPGESAVAVHLYQAITREERFEWLVEKATEVGVARIVPLMTARSAVRTDAGIDRWRRIASEAAEQCGRGAVPSIEAPQALGAALRSSPGLRLLPYEAALPGTPSIAAAMRERAAGADAVSIFIGPEGGYEPAEVEQAAAAGAVVVSMGSRVMISETAGLVAVTLVMQALGELG